MYGGHGISWNCGASSFSQEALTRHCYGCNVCNVELRVCVHAARVFTFISRTQLLAHFFVAVRCCSAMLPAMQSKALQHSLVRSRRALRAPVCVLCSVPLYVSCVCECAGVNAMHCQRGVYEAFLTVLSSHVKSRARELHDRLAAVAATPWQPPLFASYLSARLVCSLIKHAGKQDSDRLPACLHDGPKSSRAGVAGVVPV